MKCANFQYYVQNRVYMSREKKSQIKLACNNYAKINMEKSRLIMNRIQLKNKKYLKCQLNPRKHRRFAELCVKFRKAHRPWFVGMSQSVLRFNLLG